MGKKEVKFGRFQKVGALKAAEAEAPATPSKEAVEDPITTEATPSFYPTLQNPHADPSEEVFNKFKY